MVQDRMNSLTETLTDSSPKLLHSAKKFENDELDSWFNDLDEKMVEIINNDLIKEEAADDNESDHSEEITDDNDDPIDASEYIYVEDILKKNYESLTSNQLIQYECSIAYFIQVLMEGSNVNKIKSYKIHDTNLTFEKLADIVIYLSWISSASEILAKRIGQELLAFVPDNTPSIVRSSYNFCTGCTQCKKFYRKHETPICKEHHYVHSLLKYDVDSVIFFLGQIIKNNVTMNKEELNNLYLSIKTICFVTRHMAKEISYIDYITKNNSENFHRNNPIDLTRKKPMVKKIWHNDNFDRTNADNNDRIIHRQNVTNLVPMARSTRQNDNAPNRQKNNHGSDDSFNPNQDRRFTQHKYRDFNRDQRFTRPDDVGGFKKTNSFIVSKQNETMPDKNINRYSVLSEF